MGCRPALELYRLPLLKANLTIDHVRGGMVASVAITGPAVRTCIVPKLNLGLPGGHFHGLGLMGKVSWARSPGLAREGHPSHSHIIWASREVCQTKSEVLN